MDEFNKINTYLDKIRIELGNRRGAVFYTGKNAFFRPSAVYILGFNPGGKGNVQNEFTIEKDIDIWRSRNEDHSAYDPTQDVWANKSMQCRIMHMINSLGLIASHVPASNVLFVGSSTAGKLDVDDDVYNKCWEVHNAVISILNVKVVICMGKRAGNFVRQRLNTNASSLDQFCEYNRRHWISQAHSNDAGQFVFSLSHPSVADWTKPETDPIPMVKRVLSKATDDDVRKLSR